MKSGDLHFANPASQHTDGKSSRRSINQARSYIYQTFNKSEKEDELFFHSGATEGIHTFARSFALEAKKQGRKLLICYAEGDHPCVLALRESELGDHVTFFELKTDRYLRYDHEQNYQDLRAQKSADPSLMILYHHLWVHNETGIVSALEKMSEFKAIPDLYIHVDAVQSPGKISDWTQAQVGDVFTYSCHKFGALKGVGFSFFKKSLPFHPLILGGGQQSSLRSGTENPMGAWSTKLALEDLQKTDVKKNLKLRSELETFMEGELAGVGMLPFKELTSRNNNTIYFSLNSLSSDIALALFDLSGLEISAGSACSSAAAKASVVMTKLGLIDQAKNGLRLSFGFDFTEDDLRILKDRLKVVFQKLKQAL